MMDCILLNISETGHLAEENSAAGDNGTSSSGWSNASKKKIEEALTAKQEADAKAFTLEEKLKIIETENAELKLKVSHVLHSCW